MKKLKKVYEQLVAFKEIATMMELTLPHTLTSHQRKQVNHLADKLNLAHISQVMENDNKNSQKHSFVIKKITSSDENTNSAKSKNQRPKSWSAEKNATESVGTEQKRNTISIPQRSSFTRLSPSNSPPIRNVQNYLRNTIAIQPVRQPRGPDGTRGFTAGRGKLISSSN